MYKRISNLEHLLSAYYQALRGKRGNPSVTAFDFFFEHHLFKLHSELVKQTYSPLPYMHFIIHDPKKRHVAAPAFRDRILQHSLVATIEPLFERKFIYDSCACRKGRGTHFGMKRVKKFLMAARCIYGATTPIYFLQCDIRKFFPSVSWDILLALVKKTIKDAEVYALIQRVITIHNKGNEFIQPKQSGQLSLFAKADVAEVISVQQRRGLPIGNLTSQLFANVYLNELDHFVKDILRERWYSRYMDDFLAIHPNREHLKEVRDTIRDFLAEKLKLKLHPNKVAIRNVADGIPFVGYRIFYDHVLVRGATLRRMQRKYKKRIKEYQQGLLSEKKLSAAVSSFLGHFKHADTWHLRQQMFR